MKIAMILMLVFSLFSMGKAKIEIDNDSDDCVDGWISMDVDITVDDEDFDFNPSCDFSFSKSFETKSGIDCKVKAGMCSGFSPEKELHVDCSDGSHEEIEILCPAENK